MFLPGYQIPLSLFLISWNCNISYRRTNGMIFFWKSIIVKSVDSCLYFLMFYWIIYFNNFMFNYFYLFLTQEDSTMYILSFLCFFCFSVIFSLFSFIFLFQVVHSNHPHSLCSLWCLYSVVLIILGFQIFPEFCQLLFCFLLWFCHFSLTFFAPLLFDIF